MPILPNPKHEAFAQALARGSSAAAAYVEAGYKDNRHNAATLARKQHILTRVGELQEEQFAIHQQVTAEAAAKAKVTIESLIQEAEAARVEQVLSMVHEPTSLDAPVGEDGDATLAV
jgi:hypothetical protein